MSDWFKRVFLGIAILGLLAAAPAQAQNGRGQDPVVPGEIIVGVRPGVAVDAVAAALNAISVRSLGGGGAFLLQVDDDPVNAAARARRLPGVGYADPNYIRSLYGSNDTDYGLKWDLDNVDPNLCDLRDVNDCATPDADMDWAEAYANYGNAIAGDAVIAVLDTGADLDHPDLIYKLIPGWDYFDNDNIPEDDYGHGTHVAGIAAAETNNVTGTAGVAWLANVKVMPLKVCGLIQGFFGDVYACPDDAIISAIYHAIDNDADVINMSLGGGSRSKAQENAVDAAWNAGLVIVASSGNDYSDNKVSFPAAYVNAIAVGATDWNDVRSPYSNGGNALDVVAPGGRMVYYHDLGGIYSTMPEGDVILTTEFGYANGYDQLQGTSMAAPQVAGLAALLFAQGHDNTVVRALIESTADDLGAAGWDKLYGHGRINVDAALSGTPPPPPNDAPTVSITSPTDGSTFDSGTNISFAGSADDTEDGDLTASLVWTSDIDGEIGTGGDFSTVLTDGSHTITASVTDSGDEPGSFSVSITVGDPPVEATAVSVNAITYATEGGRIQDKHLLITVALVDDVGGASVSIDLFRDGSKIASGTGTTGTGGTVTFSLKNAQLGCYTTDVTDVDGDASVVTPGNTFSLRGASCS